MFLRAPLLTCLHRGRRSRDQIIGPPQIGDPPARVNARIADEVVPARKSAVERPSSSELSREQQFSSFPRPVSTAQGEEHDVRPDPHMTKVP